MSQFDIRKWRNQLNESTGQNKRMSEQEKEETLEAVKERRQGIRNAARQWSLLVWLLSDESRAISEDASDLTRQLILVARSNNYQEIAEMISFVKESAKEEDKRS